MAGAYCRMMETMEGLLRQGLRGAGSGDTVVLDVSAEPVEDDDGEPIWKVTLVLPHPKEETWDEGQVFLLKTLVADEIAKITALHRDWQLPGIPFVAIATTDPDLDNTAPEDEVEDPDQSGRAVAADA